ncbi:MAG: hypothetical protein GX112_03485 [Clostridiaceae bacterium]|jgi:hypothetical protein|nr:hypothetical protein [Clostridiaceae bacterium]
MNGTPSRSEALRCHDLGFSRCQDATAHFLITAGSKTNSICNKTHQKALADCGGALGNRVDALDAGCCSSRGCLSGAGRRFANEFDLLRKLALALHKNYLAAFVAAGAKQKEICSIKQNMKRCYMKHQVLEAVILHDITVAKRQAE